MSRMHGLITTVRPWVACLNLLISPLAASEAAERTELFVVGTLYSRHESMPGYDLPALRQLVLDVDPDVVVIDCTPTEIRERKVHPSKIEYPQVLFPLIDQHGYRVYAGEPDEPLFTQIVQPLGRALAQYAETHPAETQVLKAYEQAMYGMLKLHWRSPVEVHDETTGLMLAAQEAAFSEFQGEIRARANRDWIAHWVSMVRRAVAENPGKRILALPGLHNRRGIIEQLKEDADVNLVDVASWLAGKGRREKSAASENSG